MATALVLLGGAARAELPPELTRILSDARLPPTALALVVAPAAGGTRYLEHQAARPMQPGSTMKLVTTLVGLEQLGPAWRGRTRLLSTGTLTDGVLQGDLILQGGADLDLTWQALHGLLQRARHRGVREIRGALVLDRSAFQPARLDIGASAFDEAREFAYNAIPDALFVNENLLRLDIFVDPQQGLRALPLVPLHNVSISHEQMTLVEGDCTRWDEGWQTPELKVLPGRKLDVVLKGAWPSRCERVVSLNLIERNEFTARLVRALWTQLGGRWFGGVREGIAPADATLLAERMSRPLSDLVRAINKPSDNAFTRMLLLAIGRQAPGEAGEPTLVRAGRAVRGWLSARGIADEGFVLDNGSGLSRSERLTAAQLEAVLRAGLASRWAPEFVSSLPIAGVDGTLRTRLAGSMAAGRARLKTGTLRNVVALAGTMVDAGGEPLVVAAILNNDDQGPRQMRPVIDALIDWIARTRFRAAGAPGAAAATTSQVRPAQAGAGARTQPAGLSSASEPDGWGEEERLTR